MAEKKNYSGMVGEVYPTNQWGDLRLESYMGLDEGKHTFEVKFLDSGNRYNIIKWDSIRKGSVTDSKARKVKTAKNKQAKFWEKKNKMEKEKKADYTPINLINERFLAVDLSTIGTGVSLFHMGTLTNWKEVHLVKNLNTDARMLAMAEMVLETCKKQDVRIIVVEGIYLGNNVAVFETLAEARGVLKGLLLRNNIRVHTVPVSYWKSVMGITGNREEQKAKSMELAHNFVGEPVGEDTSDSINLGRACIR